MELALGSREGFLFILRWIHFLSGITWIGLLYYFNFVQGDYFKEIEAASKNVAVQKLVPRALWWFRWAAMVTFLSGVVMITGVLHTGMPLASGWGMLILIGGGLGTLMFLNVWLLIWPKQKIVIASANQVLAGGQALPNAAEAGSRALMVSRTNVMFSFPMLFFMGAARHLMLARDYSQVNFGMLAAVLAIILLVLEYNAVKGKNLGPLTTVKGVIHCGVILTLVLYLAVEVFTR